MSSTRFFKLLEKNEYGDNWTGRYKGSPKQAAMKAATAQFFKNKQLGINNDEIDITTKESTRNSRKKNYYYSAKRIKLDNPMHIQFGNNTVIYNYKNLITKKYPSENKIEKPKTQKQQITPEIIQEIKLPSTIPKNIYIPIIYI